MGYQRSLEAAGATVIAYESFGCYQGDWWAKVQYNDNIGWVHGWYGSCSVCDAFESEFGWDDNIDQNKLAEFGRSYLEPLYSQEEAEKIAAKDIKWDLDAKEMLQFIKDNA
jgi:hypothetical protein